MLSSAAVEVTPSRIFSSAAVDVIVVPPRDRDGAITNPELGLYLNAPVSSSRPLLSLWNTTGKLVLAVLLVTVTVAAKVAFAGVMFAVPSKDVPPIVLAFARAVAVPALPL